MRSTPRSPRTHHTVLWHTSLPPPIFRSSTSNSNLQSSHAREDPSLCRCRVLLSLSLSLSLFQFSSAKIHSFRNWSLFFPRHLPFCSLPSRGFGFRSSENAITLFTKCCTTDSSATSGLPPDRFSAVCSWTNAVPSSSSLMSRWMAAATPKSIRDYRKRSRPPIPLPLNRIETYSSKIAIILSIVRE